MRSSRYFELMSNDNRVIEISLSNEKRVLIFFSITDDIYNYSNKGQWDYIEHNPKGHVCFIEMMIAKEWSSKLRRMVDDFISYHYPSVEYAVWYRTRNGINNKVKSRRISYVRNKVSI